MSQSSSFEDTFARIAHQLRVGADPNKQQIAVVEQPAARGVGSAATTGGGVSRTEIDNFVRTNPSAFGGKTVPAPRSPHPDETIAVGRIVGEQASPHAIRAGATVAGQPGASDEMYHAYPADYANQGPAAAEPPIDPTLFGGRRR